MLRLLLPIPWLLAMPMVMEDLLGIRILSRVGWFTLPPVLPRSGSLTLVKVALLLLLPLMLVVWISEKVVLELERLLALWLECKLLLLLRGVPVMLEMLWLVLITR